MSTALSDVLREARLAAQLTQMQTIKQLTSQGLEVSQSMLSAVENGSRSPNRELLVGLATVYGLDAHDLLRIFVDAEDNRIKNAIEREWIDALRQRDIRKAKRMMTQHFLAA